MTNKRSITSDRAEPEKYDWYENRRWKNLTLGRKIPGDIGIFRVDRSGTDDDILCNLLAKNLLTGDAFIDAQELCLRRASIQVSRETPQNEKEKELSEILQSEEW